MKKKSNSEFNKYKEELKRMEYENSLKEIEDDIQKMKKEMNIKTIIQH
jgi:hypothetical protein